MPNADHSTEPIAFMPSPIEWAFPRSPAEVRAAIVEVLQEASGRRKVGRIASTAADLLRLTPVELRLPLSSQQLANVPVRAVAGGQWRLALRLTLSSLLRAQIIDRAGNGYKVTEEHRDSSISDIEKLVAQLPSDIGHDLTIADLANLILQRMRANSSFSPTAASAEIHRMITEHTDGQCDAPTPSHHGVFASHKSQAHCDYLSTVCLSNLEALELIAPVEDSSLVIFAREPLVPYEQVITAYAETVTITPPREMEDQPVRRKGGIPKSTRATEAETPIDHQAFLAAARNTLSRVPADILNQWTTTASTAIAAAQDWITAGEPSDTQDTSEALTAIRNVCFTVLLQAAKEPLSIDEIRKRAEGFARFAKDIDLISLKGPLTRRDLARVPSRYRGPDNNRWQKVTYDALRALVAIGAAERLPTREFVLDSQWRQSNTDVDKVQPEYEVLAQKRIIPLTLLEVQYAILCVLRRWRSLRPSWKPPSYGQLLSLVNDGYAATAQPGDVDLLLTTEQIALLALPRRVTAKQTQVGQLFHAALDDLVRCGLVHARPEDRSLRFRELSVVATAVDGPTVDDLVQATSSGRRLYADTATSVVTANELAGNIFKSVSDSPLPSLALVDLYRRLQSEISTEENITPAERDDLQERLREQTDRLATRRFVELEPCSSIRTSRSASNLHPDDCMQIIVSGKSLKGAVTFHEQITPLPWISDCVQTLFKAYPDWLRRDEIADRIADKLGLNWGQRVLPTRSGGLEYRERVARVLSVLRELGFVKRRRSEAPYGPTFSSTRGWEFRWTRAASRARPSDTLHAVDRWLSHLSGTWRGVIWQANEMLEHLATPSSGLPSDEDLAVAVLEALKTNGERQRLPAICKGVARRLSVPAPVAEQDGPPWIDWVSEHDKPLARKTKSSSLLEYRINLALDVMRQFGWVREESAQNSRNPWTITEVGASVAPEHVARALADDWQSRRRSLEDWKLEQWMTDWYDRMVPLGGYAFELLCADILSWDSRFDVCVRGGRRDGGLDIEIRDDRLRRRHFAQCKGWVGERKVNHKVVREMPGAVSGTRRANDEGYDAGYAILMASGELTSDLHDEGAWQFADSHFDEFIVVDGKRLLELVRQTGVGIIVRSHDDIIVDEGYFDELAERARKKIDH